MCVRIGGELGAKKHEKYDHGKNDEVYKKANPDHRRTKMLDRCRRAQAGEER